MNRSILASLLAGVLLPSWAVAEPEVEAPPDPLASATWSTRIVDRPVGLSAGMLEADLMVYASLSTDAVGEPVRIPPAVYYGVTDRVQLSLHHPNGLCITGKRHGCRRAYDDVGLRGTVSLYGRGGSIEVAALAELDVTSFEPFTLRAVIGPVLNWVLGGVVVVYTSPGLAIGLTERDAGNEEALAWPVYLYFQATPHLAPYLSTGLFAPFRGFGDAAAVPVGIGLFWGVDASVDLIAELGFTNLAGAAPPEGSRADGRQVMVQVNVRPF